MPRGQYQRYIRCEQCGTEYYVGNHTCPQCGFARELSKNTKRTLANPPKGYRQEAVECPQCHQQIGKAGIGSHMARAHGMSGGLSGIPKNYIGRAAKRGDWTLSLANGKKQIAATVSDAVAKRIIGMLF